MEFNIYPRFLWSETERKKVPCKIEKAVFGYFFQLKKVSEKI